MGMRVTVVLRRRRNVRPRVEVWGMSRGDRMDKGRGMGTGKGMDRGQRLRSHSGLFYFT